MLAEVEHAAPLLSLLAIAMWAAVATLSERRAARLARELAASQRRADALAARLSSGPRAADAKGIH